MDKSQRPFSANDYEQLKLATRRQIKANGGLEAAATRTRVGKTELGYYQQSRGENRFVPIDVAADLMAASGRTILLEALASMSNCVVVPLAIEGDGLERDMVTFGEYASATFRDYAAVQVARAPHELDLARLDRDLEEVIRIAAHARTRVRDLRAAAKPAPRRAG